MNKKGVLFTIGLLFLSLIILTFSIVIYNFEKSKQEVTTTMIILERTYNENQAIQTGLKEIFQNKSGIILEKNATYIKFKESLPNSKSDIFKNFMIEYKHYIENNTATKLKLNEIVEKLPLKIQPQNITYFHEHFGGNKISIVPDKINFDGYFLKIETNKNITSCIINLEPGNLSFEVRVVGISGDPCQNVTKINPYGNNFVKVNEKIKINVDNGKLSIVNEYKEPISVETKLYLTSKEVCYPSKIINTSYPIFGISKVNTVCF